MRTSGNYLYQDWKPRNTVMIYDGSHGRLDDEHSLTSYTFDGIVYALGYFGKDVTERMLYRTAEEWHKESMDAATRGTARHRDRAGEAK